MLDEKVLPTAPHKEWWEIFDCKREEVEDMAEAILATVEELQGMPFQAALAIHKEYLATFSPPSVLSIVKPTTSAPVKGKPLVS